MDVDNFAEIKKDWSKEKTPEDSIFPLINLEERKQIGLKIAKIIAFKKQKAFSMTLDDLLAEALFFAWNDKELTKKIIGSGETKEEQIASFTSAMFRVLDSFIRNENIKVGSLKRKDAETLDQVEGKVDCA